MKIKFLSISLVLVTAIFLLSFTVDKQEVESDDPFIVVLDAGHGGHDPGNLGNGYLEKKIALNIVLKVGEILEKNKDIKVIYTRKDDTFIDLYVRGEVANKANADLFVSVHCDSHTSDAHGAGTFVLGLHANKQNFEIAKKENSVIYLEDNYENRYADYDINSPESVIGLTIMQEEFLDQSVALATMIQENFSRQLKRTDRKVKQAGFIVLHQTFMPSVLVETGFLTNKDEGAYLNSTKGQNEMGDAIAKAILNYKEGVQPTVKNVETTVSKP
ncbi:MAG: N-acetylmuramoyl-L-alanine amidase, partial [Flavobacteriaceae bacterium]